MILNVSGNINRYYVQTLCMVFFPGATFGADEEVRDGVPVMKNAAGTLHFLRVSRICAVYPFS